MVDALEFLKLVKKILQRRIALQNNISFQCGMQAGKGIIISPMVIKYIANCSSYSKVFIWRRAFVEIDAVDLI